MFRSTDTQIGSDLPGSFIAAAKASVNEVGSPDQFVTLEPTPKSESRRGWRRRRVRKGKS